MIYRYDFDESTTLVLTFTLLRELTQQPNENNWRLVTKCKLARPMIVKQTPNCILASLVWLAVDHSLNQLVCEEILLLSGAMGYT